MGFIIGSNRPSSQSKRICDVMKTCMSDEDQTCTFETFSLDTLNIPLWSEEKWDQTSETAQNWQPIRTRLSSVSSVVVITPEWGGMVPPHLKNFLLMCDKGELAHKPGLIVSVSTGMGGAYPVSELRSSGYKNTYIWWLPDHLILRKVTDLFQDTPDPVSESLRHRMIYCLRFLSQSAQALEDVRAKCQDLETYPFGM